jgi:hypothetical protein
MRVMLKRLAIGWLLFVPLATLWGVLTYSGPYRWLCEWQLATGGEYDASMTAVIPALLLIAPAVLFLRTQLPDKPPAVATPPDPAAAERSARRVLGTVGLTAAAVCAGTLLWAWHLPDRNGPSLAVDLATLGNAPPPLGRITLIGAIDADHVTRKLDVGNGSFEGGRNLYAPMVVPGAANGTGRIFVDEYAGSGMTQPLPTDAGNRFRGVMIEGGLPGDMRRQFARIGVRVADPYYVLRTSPDGARGNYYVAAGLSGFVALLALIPLALILVASARRRRSP